MRQSKQWWSGSVVAALSLCAGLALAAGTANASTVTYDFSPGASATGGGDSSTFSGYFTYDTSTHDVTAPIGITVGGTDAGTYDTLISGGNAGLYIATNTTTGDQIDIYLATFLNGTSPDTLSTVYWGTVADPATVQSTTETGFVSPTPLPAALPLFAGGLGFVGYLTGRKKRKAGQALAAA
jgi:hypothetical protein